MLPILVAVYYWIVVVLSLVGFFLPALLIFLLTWPFDRRLWVMQRISCWWGMFYVITHPYWSVEIEGRELFDDSVGTVLCPNHQSLLDILVLYYLKKHFKWVSKVENFRLPFAGWVMSLNRYVVLRRGDRKSVKKMFEDCQRHLGQGSSVLIFPEGTRSQDGRLQGFQNGAFTLAKRTGSKIQPIVVEGTANAVPKGKLISRKPVRIRIKVLAALDPKEYSAKELLQECRSRILSELAGMRGVSEAEVDGLNPDPAPVAKG
ncbi:MAG: 1-acyl-sn-glycerol-3-phosphate acyltransferase [Planctomycetota bacterium]|nr:MAG: 1-acyl-sn-glycerol-3-phosphate acyltransferase [Planctomycetota bacterium]